MTSFGLPKLYALLILNMRSTVQICVKYMYIKISRVLHWAHWWWPDFGHLKEEEEEKKEKLPPPSLPLSLPSPPPELTDSSTTTSFFFDVKISPTRLSPADPKLNEMHPLFNNIHFLFFHNPPPYALGGLRRPPPTNLEAEPMLPTSSSMPNQPDSHVRFPDIFFPSSLTTGIIRYRCWCCHRLCVVPQPNNWSSSNSNWSSGSSEEAEGKNP